MPSFQPHVSNKKLIITKSVEGEKGVIKNFANFTRKQQFWSLFLIAAGLFNPATLLKRDSNTGVFL